MIWATWRQHRTQTLAGIALLAAMIALMLAAHPYGFDVSGGPNVLGTWVVTMMGALPIITAVFVGAPLLSRDIERHTHRLVWTQSMSRAHWVVVKLLLVFTPVVAAASVVGLGAMLLLLHDPSVDPWDWFDLQGPVFVAYTAFGLGLGTAAGAVIGRPYVAMALTPVLFTAARWLVATALRPRYLEPVQAAWTARPGDFALPPGVSSPWVLEIDWNRHLVTYHPFEHYWLLHGIEAAVFFALAALLVGLTFYWVTRRVR